MTDIFKENIDATPNKQVLMSISKDIDLPRGICEMIDNSIDNWNINNNKNQLKISILFDEGKKTIEYNDNAGGIKEEHLSLIIQPGGTERSTDEETIGLFGVGSKRALIALSSYSETVSRYDNKQTFKIIISDKWLSMENWSVEKYITDNIEPGTTKFALNNLKFFINGEIIESIKNTLANTYNFYIREKNIEIKINGIVLKPIIFKDWAFPPNREPRKYIFNIKNLEGNNIKFELLVGLMLESSQRGDYGFDVYCNDRLILKNVNDYRLGFKTGQLGTSHPTIAWFKGIIRLNGKNKDMPWNSTKSNIDPLNPTYQKILEKILIFAKPYVQLCRRLSSTSDDDIKKFKTGKIRVIDLTVRSENDDDFPNLPVGKVSYFNKAFKENKMVIEASPWTRGILENILAVDTILNAKLQNKNRFALILLDSCLEIGFKEYLIREKGIKLTKDQENYRHNLHKIIQKQNVIKNEYWTLITFYYDQRCLLYHENATPTITDADVTQFRKIVLDILNNLFKLQFSFSKNAKYLKRMIIESDDETGDDE